MRDLEQTKLQLAANLSAFETKVRQVRVIHVHMTSPLIITDTRHIHHTREQQQGGRGSHSIHARLQREAGPRSHHLCATAA